MAKYDIFISYRRDGGYDTAKHLYDLLTRDGYKVSFDIDTLRNGDFDTELLKRIDQCKDFILIVDQHCFDRTLDPGFNPKHDWLRQELAYALKHGKNIIPIFLNGVKGFPANLPPDLVAVTKKNGPEYNRYYFNDFYEKLKRDFFESKKAGGPKAKTYIIGLAIVVGLIALCVALSKGHSSSSTDTSMSDTFDLEAKIIDVISENPNIIRERNLKNFCGSFSNVSAGVMEGGINYVYCLELDPLNSSINYREENLDLDIRNSKGWIGTMMQWPEVWEVWQFDMDNEGKSAIVELRKRLFWGQDNPETVMCKVKMVLDSNNNIRMSYLSGDEAPGILIDDDGGFTSVATFRRD